MRLPQLAITGCFLIALAIRVIAQIEHPAHITAHAFIRMHDGVHLAANIFRPAEHGRFPAILVRTPYGKGVEMSAHYHAFVDRGYAVVAQDVRGRYESQGVFSPLDQEPRDGDDTINWIAAQPWSDGGVGMMGGSYLGISQWEVAVLNNPHLKAIFPIVSGDDDYRDRFYSTGGAFKLGNRLLWTSENMRLAGYDPPDFWKFIWTLPVRKTDVVATGHKSPMLQQAFDHPSEDAFWKNLSTRRKLKDFHVPVFTVGGWYDNFVESDLDAFSILRKHSSIDRIVIGPWPHNMSIPITTVDYGPHALVALRRAQLEWFDQWLKHKDMPLTSQPPVRIFVMGVDQWRDEQEWPLARARETRFYLKSDGHANTVFGDGVLSPEPATGSARDEFVYDPQHPVPTVGGAVCCNPDVFPWGPIDQRKVEKRKDVLVYSTPPLADDLEVTGPIEVVLHAASSVPDTDFTAKLVDVYPNGQAMNLTDGILRARYRNSLEKPKLMKSGRIYKFTIDVGVTSNVFRKGHRIRLEISSSNFPRFDRNPNTGRPVADETQLAKASQTIHHDQLHDSYLLLPVIPQPLPRLTSTAPTRYFAKRSASLAR